ncbi:hypothetical protein C7271_05885 [filamentous cyanobacterium CCP5]|nr:hypothetical protein C7271_05885 [filamentous cyanobacterium CCP5]
MTFGAGGHLYLYEQGAGESVLEGINLPKYMSITSISPFPLLEDYGPQAIALAPFDPGPGEENCRLILTYVFVPDAVARLLNYASFVSSTAAALITTTARFVISLVSTVIVRVRRPSRPDQTRPPLDGQSRDDDDFPS